MTKLINNLTGKVVAVKATTNHSASSYGKAVWVTSKNEAICQVGMESMAGYTLIEDNKDNARKLIGQQIRDIRTAKGLTQVDLAEMTGIKQQHFARIERGAYSIGVDVLANIADALGCEVVIKPK